MIPTKDEATPKMRRSGGFAANLRAALFTLAAAGLAAVTLAAPAGAAQSTDIQAAAHSLVTASGAGAPGTKSANATFGVQPVTNGKPDARARLTYSATPGAQISDKVAIQNFGTQPLQLHVYANDAFNTSDGGFDIQPAAVSPKDTGSWVHLAGSNFVTVPARAIVIVPIKITVPTNATPGDHAGGIVAGLNRIATDAKGNRVNVEERVGTRIYIRVPGKLVASLALAGVSTTYHNSWNPFGSGSATVSYTVRNTGNVRLAGVQSVHVSSLVGGSRPALKIPDIKELLPGQQITLSATVSGVLPSFVTTGRVTIDPSALPGDIDPKAAGVSGSGSTVSVPWPQLIVLVLLGGLAFWMIRRRRAPAAPAPVAKKQPAAVAAAAKKAATQQNEPAPKTAGVKAGG